MGSSITTIELNGKRYDARTGKVIVNDLPQLPQQKISTKKPEPGQILDGFIRRNPGRIVQPHPLEQVVNTSQTPASSLQHHRSKTEVKHLKRKLEKSRTLMRPAVKKPDMAAKTTHSKEIPIPKIGAATKSRLNRAQNTEKSPHVSRFGSVVSTITKKEVELPVVAPSFATLSKNVSTELSKLESALIDANAHLHQLEADTIKKVPFLNRVGFKNKFANLATITAAFLLLVGFFGYQNSAAISMKVAATRAGVNAQLPGYKPAGYGMEGGVKSEPGKVLVSFKSRTDDKGFTISQQASNWNSASLLANHVTKEHCNTCFQTWQDNGKTVYIYDNSNATWVSGGVWYQVEGNADLTSDQLMRLAKSL